MATDFQTKQIRQVQFLIVLLSNLPQAGKLREVVELALKSPSRTESGFTFPPTFPAESLRDILEVLWVPELGFTGPQGLVPDEQALVEWQKDFSNNLGPAIEELNKIQASLGFELTPVVK